MHRRLAAAVALSVALLLGACTDEAPKPPPPQSSAPTMPSTTPTPSVSASPTPSASAEEAIRIAITKAYTDQFTEFNRLEMAGGASRPTQKLLDSTSGELRHAIMTVLRSDKRDGIREVRPGRIAGIVVASGKGSTRKVTACEDYTKAKWVKKDGTQLKVNQPILNLQHSVAKRGADGKWRIDYTETTHLKTFKHVICNGGDK